MQLLATVPFTHRILMLSVGLSCKTIQDMMNILRFASPRWLEWNTVEYCDRIDIVHIIATNAPNSTYHFATRSRENKKQQVEREMERCGLAVMGIAEHGWLGQGRFSTARFSTADGAFMVNSETSIDAIKHSNRIRLITDSTVSILKW